MLDRGREVHTALESVRGFRAEAEPACAARDRLRPPERRLDVDRRGIERYCRVLASHHSGKRFDAAFVGNDAHPGIDFDGLAVQQLHGFACPAPAYDEAALHLVQIEDMRGSPEL